jgi:hypothetical protein
VHLELVDDPLAGLVAGSARLPGVAGALLGEAAQLAAVR